MYEELTKEEVDSALWKKIEQLYKQRLDISRKNNDGNASEIATAMLRGRIAAYRELLQLNPENMDV